MVAFHLETFAATMEMLAARTEMDPAPPETVAATTEMLAARLAMDTAPPEKVPLVPVETG